MPDPNPILRVQRTPGQHPLIRKTLELHESALTLHRLAQERTMESCVLERFDRHVHETRELHLDPVAWLATKWPGLDKPGSTG